MSKEFFVGIDYSLEKLTVVISDSAKCPIAILQVLMGFTTKNKIKNYYLEVKRYTPEGQFDSFQLSEVESRKRVLSFGSIHFQNRLSIMVEEFKIFLEGFPRELIQKVAMEAYSKFSKTNAFYTGEGYGSLKTLMYSTMNLELDYFVPPTKLKKSVLGAGDLDKEGVMYRFETERGYKFLNDDMADAYMLSIYPHTALKEDQIIRIQTK